MINIFKKNYYSRIFKKIVVFIIFLLFMTLFFKLIDFTISVNSSSISNWIITLNFEEPGGANTDIIFGEKLEASDDQDDNDLPLPPSSFPPYISSWFDAGLADPYDKLLKDIRKYPDDYKIWNLYVQWIPSDYASSTDITISWNNSELYNSEYDYMVLYDFDSTIVVANMLIIDSYSFNSLAMIPHHFQVICNSSSSSGNNPPYIPSNPFPINGTTEVNISTNLDWIGGDPDQNDLVTYDVYFGTTNNPQKIISNQSATTYNPASLNYNKTYYWKIIAWDDKGSWSEGPLWHFTTKTQTSIQINKPPIADANGPYTGLVNQNITFNASGSYDIDGTITKYNWNFGDGTTSNIKNPIHAYKINGTYIVILEVTDNNSLTDKDVTTTYIFTTDSDQDGWGDDEEHKYGTNPNDPLDFPLDTDNDHIPDSEDTDDDNDGLLDVLEEKLGSDSKNKLDVKNVIINGITHFLIDTNKDDKIDLFYNSTSGKTTNIYYTNKNQYLIDEDGDGKWDYIYDSTGSLIKYTKEEKNTIFELPFIIYPLVIMFLIGITIFILKLFFTKKS